MIQNDVSACTVYAQDLLATCLQNDSISPRLYEEYGVNLGLRDERGNGVLTGLTNISKISSSKVEGAQKVPDQGRLWYRGHTIEELITSLGDQLGFERVTHLLLSGELPSAEQEQRFKEVIASCRELPPFFVRDTIMDMPSRDVMNTITRSLLALSAYDERAVDTSVENVIRQCIQLIARMPLLAAYSYNGYNHYINYDSMYIHRPNKDFSTAENLLRMLRPDMSFTSVEAKVLDTALILHMEHGGGNNSTFTTRVVTSSGSDTYSTFAAAMASLKGPRHGGANIKAAEMMDDIREHVRDWEDEDEIRSYLGEILDKKAFDHQGLIYGMGHAVYTLSDPRERIFRVYVEMLAKEKERTKDLDLYQAVERIAPALISERRRNGKVTSPNIDFYSGFMYEMLGIPRELYTPIFAVARIVGWSAHRIEELITSSKIIRPAYMSVSR
mgnify:FL=1